MVSDHLGNPEFEYFFADNGAKLGMTWRRLKSWSKSFMGRKAGKQPRRELYLRTLANLTSPSEVRSILQAGTAAAGAAQQPADHRHFAQPGGAGERAARGPGVPGTHG